MVGGWGGGWVQNSSYMPLTIWSNLYMVRFFVLWGFASIYCAQGKLQGDIGATESEEPYASCVSETSNQRKDHCND